METKRQIIIRRHSSISSSSSSSTSLAAPFELQGLFQSCQRIIASTLSCQILVDVHNHNHEYYEQSDNNDHDDKDDDYDPVAVRDEVEIGKWLDGQIAEYETALKRRELLLLCSSETIEQQQQQQQQQQQPSDNNNNNNNSSNRRKKRRLERDQIQRLKEELFDETVQREQENLLLHRVEMSRASQAMVFPITTTTTTSTSPSSAQQFLVRDALRQRDQEVIRSIRYEQTNHALRTQIGRLVNERIVWNTKTNDLRKRLCAIEEKEQRQQTTSPSSSSSNKEVVRCQKETDYLKQAYATLLATGNINWYRDKRLYETMQTL